MRTATTLAVVGAITLVTMAFTASASATTITDEPTGVNCGTATSTSGGCSVHATGEVQLLGHVFGIEDVASDCVVETTRRIGGDGQGWVDTVLLTDHVGMDNCTRTPCSLPWPTQVNVDSGTNAISLTTTFCITGGSGDQTCTVTLPVSESPDHDYESNFHVRASSSTNAPGCEIEGQVHLEGTPIEING